MSHPFALLEAYYDGELDVGRSARLEEHLKTCALCQQELDSLRSLSELLQAAPGPGFTQSPQAFSVEIESGLPTRSPASGWQRGLELGWRLAPVALVAIWLLFRALFFVGGVLQGSGLVDTLGFDRLPEVFFLQSLPALAVLSWSEVTVNVFPGADWITAWLAPGIWNLTTTLLVGAGLWAWAASWWIYHNRYSFASRTAGDFSQKIVSTRVQTSLKGNENGSL